MSQNKPYYLPLHLRPALEASLTCTAYRLLMVVEQEATRTGTALYLVGGPVRDLILSRRSKDLDLVVEGNASELALKVAPQMAGAITVFSKFGTATIKVGRTRLDLVTARSETYSQPGALPRVKPSTIHEDLNRRDFTINSIAIGLSKSSFGQLLDPTGGINDLKLGHIRALHPQSFRDDATRMLRAIRYEQRLSFHIEPKTLRCIGKSLEENMLSTISPDRLRNEVDLMLREDHPVKTLLRAGELGVLSGIFKPLTTAHWISRLSQYDKNYGLLSYLAALTYPLSAEEGETFIARINMVKRWAKAVRDINYLKQIEQSLAHPDLSDASLFQLLNGRSNSSAAALASLTQNTLVRDRLVKYLGHLRYVKPLLQGKDLLAIGVPQGPKVGQILQKLRTARLEKRIKTRKEETQLARRHLRSAEN